MTFYRKRHVNNKTNSFVAYHLIIPNITQSKYFAECAMWAMRNFKTCDFRNYSFYYCYKYL